MSMNLWSLSLADTMGWIATAVFVESYFFAKPAMLRGLQMLGAVLWITFGVLIASKPVIASNVLVFSAAAWTLLRNRAASRTEKPATIP
jgi:hypothetical protein